MNERITIAWGADLSDQQDMLKVMADWLVKSGANWLVEIDVDGSEERVDGLAAGVIDLTLHKGTAGEEKIDALVILPVDQDGNRADEDAVPVVVRLDKIRTLVIP